MSIESRYAKKIERLGSLHEMLANPLDCHPNRYDELKEKGCIPNEFPSRGGELSLEVGVLVFHAEEDTRHFALRHSRETNEITFACFGSRDVPPLKEYPFELTIPLHRKLLRDSIRAARKFRRTVQLAY